MGRKRNIPMHFKRNAAVQAQKKFLADKMPQSERVQKNREAAGHVISMCFMSALNERYGIGEERLGRLVDAANAELERFDINKRGVGMERAKKKLTEELGDLLPEGFILPATKTPKKSRDWAMLGEQREAAEIVVWAMQNDDTHPYYFGACNVTCTAPALTQDTELEEMV